MCVFFARCKTLHLRESNRKHPPPHHTVSVSSAPLLLCRERCLWSTWARRLWLASSERKQSAQAGQSEDGSQLCPIADKGHKSRISIRVWGCTLPPPPPMYISSQNACDRISFLCEMNNEWLTTRVLLTKHLLPYTLSLHLRDQCHIHIHIVGMNFIITQTMYTHLGYVHSWLVSWPYSVAPVANSFSANNLSPVS